MGLGKFWPDLEISEVFVTGLKVSFASDFASWSLEFKSWTQILKLGSRSLKVSNLPFYTPSIKVHTIDESMT